MKIKLNKQWRIGGWTALLGALGGAGAGAAGAGAAGAGAGAAGAGLGSAAGAAGAAGGAGAATGAAGAAASGAAPAMAGGSSLSQLINSPQLSNLMAMNQQGGGNALPKEQGGQTDWLRLLGMM